MKTKGSFPAEREREIEIDIETICHPRSHRVGISGNPSLLPLSDTQQGIYEVLLGSWLQDCPWAEGMVLYLNDVSVS